MSFEEKIPWKCHRLVIGTGAYGRLPVMKEVKLEAERRQVELVMVPTSEAIRLMEKESAANAILHVTCPCGGQLLRLRHAPTRLATIPSSNL